MWDIYNAVTTELESGQLESLPELHAIACCLKAVSSADAAQGVETCRLSCGGHGYMTSSNLPSTYGLVTAMCTYEGENTVLFLQTARFLIKCWQNRGNLEKLSTVSYLGEDLTKTKQFKKSVDWIISALQLTAARKIELANRHINERVQEGTVYEMAWNDSSIELVAAAEAHCRSFLVKTLSTTVKALKVSNELKVVLLQLEELYAVHTALKLTGDLLRVCYSFKLHIFY